MGRLIDLCVESALAFDLSVYLARLSDRPGPHQILGIMNGTTNFMLTKMEGGADYGEVLAEAQALGFAEGA